jgi:hypothetical protein
VEDEHPSFYIIGCSFLPAAGPKLATWVGTECPLLPAVSGAAKCCHITQGCAGGGETPLCPAAARLLEPAGGGPWCGLANHPY